MHLWAGREVEDLEDGVAADEGVNSVRNHVPAAETHASIRLVSMTFPFCRPNEIPERKTIVVTATPMRVAEMRSGTAP